MSATLSVSRSQGYPVVGTEEAPCGFRGGRRAQTCLGTSDPRLDISFSASRVGRGRERGFVYPSFSARLDHAIPRDSSCCGMARPAEAFGSSRAQGATHGELLRCTSGHLFMRVTSTRRPREA